jgi:hypothetical protein
MPVPSRIYDLSATASSNSPAGTDTVGTEWDNYMRAHQAILRGDLATKGADIASAATTDLGAVQGYSHDITGTVTITSFGTVAAGIPKIVKFEGALTLTHNATSLILPGGENITTADGDIGFFISEGSGNWRCISFARAAVSPNSAFSTGDVKLTIKTTADAGWVLMNDGTIGNGSSGGTTRANADTVALFTLLWNNTANADCAVSTGRGANAAADFAANKTIALPKALGRALAGYGSGSGLTARAMGASTGVETVTLSAAESGLPSHSHTENLSGAAGGSPNGIQGVSSDGTASVANISTAAAGGSAASNAHQNMQPSVFLNVMIKL